MLKALTFVAVGMTFLCNVHGAFGPAQEPSVMAAVAPVFPRLPAAVKVSGKVIVEVNINRVGVVTSNNVLSGHPLLRRSAQSAARLWRFTPDPEGNEVRSVRLTFIFSLVYDEIEDELAAVFSPPYQVEVKHYVQPHNDVNELPTNSPYRQRRHFSGLLNKSTARDSCTRRGKRRRASER